MSDHLNASAVSADFTILSNVGPTSSVNRVGRAGRALTDRILRAWRRHITRRSCRAAALYLRGLNDGALGKIGLQRPEIPSAVRELEASLLDRSRSAIRGGTQ